MKSYFKRSILHYDIKGLNLFVFLSYRIKIVNLKGLFPVYMSFKVTFSQFHLIYKLQTVLISFRSLTNMGNNSFVLQRFTIIYSGKG